MITFLKYEDLDDNVGYDMDECNVKYVVWGMAGSECMLLHFRESHVAFDYTSSIKAWRSFQADGVKAALLTLCGIGMDPRWKASYNSAR